MYIETRDENFVNESSAGQSNEEINFNFDECFRP